jgi:hypothetical protein
MCRLGLACIASVLLYTVLFALLLDRPLALGFLRTQIEMKLARGAAIATPKLVILAGSNGPYSHRCETIEPILRRPCVNGGVAVGIGLDYLFARWQPLLHRGDAVYLPLEEAQYIRTRSATAVGPDGAIMLRHDWSTLAALPPDRWIGAMFAFDLRGALSSLVEMTLIASHFHDPRAAATGSMNAWGDHVGHTLALAAVSVPVLAAAHPSHVTAAQVSNGDGTAALAVFLAWAHNHGVQAIGGLPTGFADIPMPDSTVAAIRAVYRERGALWLMLPNHSEYSRAAFFDTPEHLNEPAQIMHSRAVAAALQGMLDPLLSLRVSGAIGASSGLRSRPVSCPHLEPQDLVRGAPTALLNAPLQAVGGRPSPAMTRGQAYNPIDAPIAPQALSGPRASPRPGATAGPVSAGPVPAGPVPAGPVPARPAPAER